MKNKAISKNKLHCCITWRLSAFQNLVLGLIFGTTFSPGKFSARKFLTSELLRFL